MANFQQYTFQQGRRVGQVDLTAANAWESLSNTMSSFSSTLGDYQRSLNKQHDAEVKSYINSQEDDIITTVSKLSIDHENEYDVFIEKAQAWKKTKMDVMSKDEDLGTDFAQGFGQMMDDKIAQYGEKVYAKKVKLDRARYIQTAKDTIETHALDTENMIDSVIGGYHNDPTITDEKIQAISATFQTQRDMFGGQIDELVKLGITGDEAFNEEKSLLSRFYKKAAMSELNAQIEKGNGWQTIQDFNANPSKFFSSRKHLQALFPEVNVAMSDEDKAETFKDMMSMLNGYQGQQDRMQDSIAADKAVTHANQYSFILDRIVEDPTSVTADEIKQTLASGDISNKDHDTLLKIIQTGGLYKEDDNVVSDLYTSLFDPEADQFQIYDQIQQAVRDNQITPATQKQLLSILRDGGLKDVTKDEDYQMAINEVKTEFRTTGPLAAFLPNESKNINRAIRDIYQLKKTLRPDQDFLEEVDKIKAKYKRTENVQTKVSWQSGWVGTSEAPNAEETKKLLVQQLESNQITKSQYLEQFGAVDDYMEAYSLRQGRKK
jgi:hypothetical protein